MWHVEQKLFRFTLQAIAQQVSPSGLGVLGTCLSGGYLASSRLLRSSLCCPGGPFQIGALPRGSLSNVVAWPLRGLLPGPGQVLLKVLAVGVNFRDVLNVLGMYPGNPGEPGGDVAGIVAAAGPGDLQHRWARPVAKF